jgi:hypothetical protein
MQSYVSSISHLLRALLHFFFHVSQAEPIDAASDSARFVSFMPRICSNHHYFYVYLFVCLLCLIDGVFFLHYSFLLSAQEML